jgi:hypothetical protein
MSAPIDATSENMYGLSPPPFEQSAQVKFAAQNGAPGIFTARVAMLGIATSAHEPELSASLNPPGRGYTAACRSISPPDSPHGSSPPPNQV